MLLAPAILAAAPAQPANLVLNCYLVETGRLGLGQFVRHLEVRPARSLVVIADGLRGGPPRWVGNGHLVALDANRLVYDFASSLSAGRTEIDRRSGAFHYSDGRTAITGTCQPSGL